MEIKAHIENNISGEEKIEFTDEFLHRFLEHGFGTMPKREMEILVFKYLYYSDKFFNDKRNYNMANVLKISETRVKTLKSELQQKYPNIDTKKALEKISILFFGTYKNKIINDKKEKEFRFVIEDPVLKREFENAAKLHGYFTDGSFNTEIIKIGPIPFIKIFLDVFNDEEKFQNSFNLALKGLAADDEKAKKVFQSSKTVGEKIEDFLTNHENAISVGLSLFSLANPFNVKIKG